MDVKVIFTYDEATRKWEPTVVGKDVLGVGDARDAFHAVVITCQSLDSTLLEHTRVKWNDASGGYDITPAV